MTAPYDMKKLVEIGQRLRTQDNRATQSPMFCVQVCDRIGPLIPGHGDGEVAFFDHEQAANYYADTNGCTRWKELFALYQSADLPSTITAHGYKDIWKTVQVCFSEQGCKDYLDRDGHNLRYYHGVRIYAESFHRNPEMLKIREYLLEIEEEAAAAPKFEDLFPFEYVAGGYYRAVGYPVGQQAPMLRGMNAIRYLHAAMTGADPKPFLCSEKDGEL